MTTQYRNNTGRISPFTQATTRLIRNKLSDVLSVKDFIPEKNTDGTKFDTANNDCSTYIQNAVNALHTLVNPPTSLNMTPRPATLHFPAGIYKIEKPIDFSLDGGKEFREIVGGNGTLAVAQIKIAYHGYGDTTTPISNPKTVHDKAAFYFGKKTNTSFGYTSEFSLAGFEFKGSSSHKSPPAIECRGVAQSRFENIKIGDIDNEAFILDSPQNNKLFNISIWNSGRSFGYKDSFISENYTKTLNGEAAAGQKNIVLTDVTNLVNGRIVTGTGVAANSTIASINTSTKTITLNNNLTSTLADASTLLFSTVGQSGTTLTALAGGFTNNDVGKNIALWGTNSFRRKTKITGFTSATQVTVEDSTSSDFGGKNIIFGSPSIGTYNGVTTITSDATTFSADDVGLHIWLKFTEHTHGNECLIRRKITSVAANGNSVVLDSAPTRTTAGNVKCEIAVPALSLHTTHESQQGISGNSSDNKFINLQIESHKGVGICAENQSVLDFINTKIHAEQGTTSNNISNKTAYSVSCMWLEQVDGSYLGKFEGQYIGRNKLWITGQTSAFTILNALVGSAYQEKIFGIEHKSDSFDGAALVISGLQVNHANPTHNISNLIEDRNLSLSNIPTGYLMNGPFVNQGSAVSRKIEGYVTQNVFVEEAGTTTDYPKLHINSSSGSGYLFVVNGALKWAGPNNTTQIAPA